MESLRPALQIFTFLFLAVVVASQADLDGYWKSKLPNSRMPKAVRDLLHNEWSEEKSAAVGVGKGGVNVHTGKGTNVNVGHGGVGVNTHGHGKKPGTNVGVGKGGVNVHAHHKGRPVYVGVNPGPNPFLYRYAASEDQLRSDPNVALFFLEKDLHSGKTMTLHFTTSPRPSGFLTRKAAESIPFSSESLSTVLSRFDLEPSSVEARAMKATVEECEKDAVRGEDKYCATSLESMVEFSTSKLGKNVDAISTEVQNHKGGAEVYKIVGVKKINGGSDEAVVCHRQKYAYAVFYCHGTKATEAYAVYLAGADGTKAKAAAVCHKDTAAWNPKHLAFQVLKVKPGSVPICHFLPEDHIVWVAKY